MLVGRKRTVGKKEKKEKQKQEQKEKEKQNKVHKNLRFPSGACANGTPRKAWQPFSSTFPTSRPNDVSAVGSVLVPNVKLTVDKPNRVVKRATIAAVYE